MTFLSFLRRAFGGQDPSNAIVDGQITLDTEAGYLYADVNVSTDPTTPNIKRISITDRRDSIKLYTVGALDTATHNGWYNLDLGEGETDTILIGGYEGYGVTIDRYAYLLVTGTNKKQITQILFTHSDEGRILIRHSNYKASKENAINWAPWQIQDKIATVDGSLCQT